MNEIQSVSWPVCFLGKISLMSLRHDTEVQQNLARYSLALPFVPTSGRSGELLGRGTGSSLEFQEYRTYQLGDDIRHLDWAAYARSDHLMVRLFREEISPHVEILLDASRSMTTGDGTKARVALQLTSLLAQLCGRMSGQPRVIVAKSERPCPAYGLNQLDLLTPSLFSSVTNIDELLTDHAVTFRGKSIRIVISDFMFPHDPQSLVRRLATNASALWMIQLLTRWESHPTNLGGHRLTDVESGQEVDLYLNESVLTNYRNRLKTLQDSLRINAQRLHSKFVVAIADETLSPLCRSTLVPAGLLTSGI